MADRSLTHVLQFQVTKLLVAAVVVAVAATGALIVTALVDLPGPPPPPGPNGMPPPPPDLRALAVLPILTGFFVLSWLAVLVIFARDQILARLREQHDRLREQHDRLLHLREQHDQALLRQREQHHEVLRRLGAEHDTMSREEIGRLLAELRAELADDRERELTTLTEQLADYGERRETDGYLKGMRTAAMNDQPEANVRALRRTPPQR